MQSFVSQLLAGCLSCIAYNYRKEDHKRPQVFYDSNYFWISLRTLPGIETAYLCTCAVSSTVLCQQQFGFGQPKFK